MSLIQKRSMAKIIRGWGVPEEKISYTGYRNVIWLSENIKLFTGLEATNKLYVSHCRAILKGKPAKLLKLLAKIYEEAEGDLNILSITWEWQGIQPHKGRIDLELRFKQDAKPIEMIKLVESLEFIKQIIIKDMAKALSKK
jgi:hypothetical protein